MIEAQTLPGFHPEVQAVLTYFGMFLVLYGASAAVSSAIPTYAALDASKRAYWNASVVSTLHAVLISYVGYTALMETPSFMLVHASEARLQSPLGKEAFRIFLG